MSRSDRHTLTAWTPTPGGRRGLVAGLLCLTVGVLTRRPALVLLGAPLLLVCLPALTHRPAARRAGPARWWAESAPVPGGDGRAVLVRTVVELPPDCAVAVLRLSEPDRMVVRAVARPPDGVLRHEQQLTPTGWGPVRLAQPDLMLGDALGLLAAGPAEGPVLRSVVLPERDAGARDALSPAPHRLVGRHRRRAAGHSTEPFDLRGYRPGDPLRQVDARASARRRARSQPGRPVVEDLMVRRRTAEADADLVLLLDARSDVVADLTGWDRVADRARPPGGGPGGLLGRHGPTGYRAGTAAEGGSIDAVARLGAALAAAYLEAGDRVAVANLADPRRGLLAGAGPRHLLRVEHLLARFQVDRNLLFRPGALVPSFEPLLAGVARHASVVVAAVLLDDDVVDLVLHLARRGHPVVVADATPALRPGPDPSSRTAVLLVAAEHRARVARLLAAGCPVVRTDPQQVAVALAGAARTEARR